MYKKKNFRVSRKLLQAHKKVCDENERREKRLLHKNFCGDRKALIRLYQKNGWINVFQLRDIDSSNNEGTNSLVNGRIGRERMVRRTTGTIKLTMGDT